MAKGIESFTVASEAARFDQSFELSVDDSTNIESFLNLSLT